MGLRILGKRQDGYHEISTVLQTISLHDKVLFAVPQGSAIVFSCDDPSIPSDSSNLVVRGAHALQDRYEIKVGATIHLEKRIPVKGGLGGGSSNAAVALLGLAHLWELETSVADLLHIATGLGADVPFFLRGGRVLATGIGTRLSLLVDGEKQHLVIIAPKAAVATVDAYKALQSPALTTSNSESILAVSRTESNLTDSDPKLLHDHLENDFEKVIFDIEPEIERAKAVLLQAGARSALLAGSGSSVFGIFENREEQQRAVHEIQVESGWRIFSCVTVAREEYLRAMGSCGSLLTL